MKLRTVLIASVLAVGAVTPTLAADWDKIHSVDVTRGPDHDSVSPDFAGPVERLRFTARESGVVCSGINAVFASGTKARLFAGAIPQGTSRTVNLPGAQRNIRKLNFNCHATQAGGGRIVIEGDIGQYRAVWMKSPLWARFWGNVFGNQWDQAINYWVYVGRTTFTGGRDTDGMFAGWAGKSVTTIGLRPLNDDARCGKAVVTLANGSRHELDIDRGDFLHEGRTYRVDLPGGDRHIVKLSLRCRAVHGHSVTMNIYAKK